jgi:hypothetical protein
MKPIFAVKLIMHGAMKKLSSQNRLIALGLCALALTTIAWKMSFSKTLEAFQRVQENAKQIERLSKAPALAVAYQKQITAFKNGERTKPYNREVLFEAVNTFCRSHDIQILKFHPEQRVFDQRFELITNELEVQGSFKDLVKLGWHVEQEEKLGHIASATYHSQEDKRTHKTSLIGRLIIQHYLQYQENAPN